MEVLERVNTKLHSEFGEDHNSPKFRVVYSDDQFENRWMTHTAEGLELIYPEVRLVPKYKHYIQHRYILERFVPIVGDTDLTVKAGYEPCWTFILGIDISSDTFYDACKFIIEGLLIRSGRPSGHAKYKDPDESPEGRALKIEKMKEFLFGNETDTGDALAHHLGVSNPAEPKHFEKETSTTVEKQGN